MPNMVPKWAQVGAMLGSKIVLNASKGEQKNGTENGTKIKLKNLSSENRDRQRRRLKMASPGGLGGYLAKAK